jgi:hypothetical protein
MASCPDISHKDSTVLNSGSKDTTSFVVICPGFLGISGVVSYNMAGATSVRKWLESGRRDT